ncbi:MAG: MFS transporter [Candidatus Dormibacteria bacterium]
MPVSRVKDQTEVTERAGAGGTSTPAEAAEANATAELSPGYRELLRQPGMRRVLSGMLLGRTAEMAVEVAIVLFVLGRYRSPALAGAAAFCAIAPGLLLSPLAGALLDRHGRARLVMLDYVVAGTAMAVIAGLSLAGHLPAPVLLCLLVAKSLTSPLSNSGLRSLFPLILPRRLWDRANAVDSSSFVIAMVVGPAIAGTLVATLGGEGALLVAGAIFLAAGAATHGIPEPRTRGNTADHVLRAALDGMLFVARNPTLRGLGITVSVFNLGYGTFNVALPVVLARRFHQGPATVGLILAILGAAGFVSGLLAGRTDSRGRERRLLALGGALSAVGMLAVAGAPGLVAVAAGAAVMGLANGPFDIGLFALRQRRTPSGWLGRAFAVSMSVNFIGFPLGAALGGPIVARSAEVALVLGVATQVVAGGLIYLLVPRDAPGDAGRPPAAP